MLFKNANIRDAIDIMTFKRPAAISSFRSCSERFGVKAAAALKHDHAIDYIYQQFKGALAVEVRLVKDNGSSNSPIDQFYYVFTNERLRTLGEEFWSEYHAWHRALEKFLVCNWESIDIPTQDHLLMGGSRNNFTHMIIDHLPVYLLAHNHRITEFSEIFTGLRNPIFDEVMHPLLKDIRFAENPKRCILEIPIGAGMKAMVYAIRANCLHAYSFVSIYTCIELTREYISRFSVSEFPQFRSRRVYLERKKRDRILNPEYVSQLAKDQGYKAFRDVESVPLFSRMSYFRDVEEAICPPGSDNINALLFMPNAKVHQMMAIPKAQIGKRDFRTIVFSGLRYLMPESKRMNFWLANEPMGINQGIWGHFMLETNLSALIN